MATSDRDDAIKAFFSFGMIFRSITQSLPKADCLAGLHGPHLGLFFVLSHGPARRMTDLAEMAGTSSANLTGLIDRLEERGLIERVRSEVDRRVVLVRLTDQGTQAHERMHEAMRERVDGLMAALTVEEQRAFKATADKLLAAAGLEYPRPDDVDGMHPWRKKDAAR